MSSSDWLKIIVIFGPIEAILLIIMLARWLLYTRPIKKYLKQRAKFYALHPTYDERYGVLPPADISDPLDNDADRIDYVEFHGYKCGLGTVFKAKWEGYVLAINKGVDKWFVHGEPNRFQDYLKKYQCVYLKLTESLIDGTYTYTVVEPTEDGHFVPLVKDLKQHISVHCNLGTTLTSFYGDMHTSCIPDVMFESVEEYVLFDEKEFKRWKRGLDRENKKKAGTLIGVNIFTRGIPIGIITCGYLFLMVCAQDSIGAMLVITVIYAVLLIRFYILGI